MKIISDFKRYEKTNNKIKLCLLFIDNIIFNTAFQAILLYRCSNFFYKIRIPIIHRLLNSIQRVITGSDISYSAEIGKGLMIVHGMGVIIGANAKVGENAYILNNITIGSKVPGGQQPVIGNNVYIGVGARILGDIKIGNNVTIGANAVVIKDVPDNSVVVGIPGRIVYKNE